ncbi:DUF3341 domain-containing protein [Schlesneria paludicola]|uniref:DUF3341 domain-containing protein n=1 Tax=Schlesneria paludicola TaxID=360056 RepID=UPI000680BFE9|nr:DUF3341 domain-containing protein [Schlesneria paludicola]
MDVIPPAERLYGLLAEFDVAEAVVDAAHQAHAAGYRQMNAYTPFPVEGLSAALGQRPTRLPWVVLIGGVLGGVTAYATMSYASIVSYPLNVGGRPLNSWPSFIPITFELTILGAAFGAFFGMLALNGLPHPHHPLFNVPAFSLATRDRFFLCIQSRDPRFELEQTRAFLQGMSLHVHEVQP